MKESEQLLSYLWTCACKDANKSAIWKRSVTLNLGYQNIKKKQLLRPSHYLLYLWSINDCITSRVVIATKHDIRKKIQNLILMKDFCSLISPSIISNSMYHSISGVAFINSDAF